MMLGLDINATLPAVHNCIVITLKSSFYQQINTEAFRRDST